MTLFLAERRASRQVVRRARPHLRHTSLAVAIGTLTPRVLYGIETPYAVVDDDTLNASRTGDEVSVSSGGAVVVP